MQLRAFNCISRSVARRLCAVGASISFVFLAGCSSISMHAESSPDIWSSLEQRPLQLDSVGQGQSECPVTSAIRVDDGGYALGTSPIFLRVDALSSAAVVYFGDGAPDTLGRKLAKVMFRFDASFAGPILIRGTRVDESGELGISLDSVGSNELRLNIVHDQPGTETWPAYLGFRQAGCYGIQLDGADVSRQIYIWASSSVAPS